MWSRYFAYVIFGLWVMFLAAQAAAQESIKADEMLHTLQDKHNEYVVASGLMRTPAGGVHQMVMTASTKGGWSLLAITPTGCASILMAGDFFAAQKIPPIGNDT